MYFKRFHVSNSLLLFPLVIIFQSTTKKGKNVSVSNEDSTFNLSNYESRSERHVQEEQPGLRTSGEKAAPPVPVRKDPLVSPSSSKSEDPFKSFYENRLSRRPRLFDKTYKRAKPSSTEPSMCDLFCFSLAFILSFIPLVFHHFSYMFLAKHCSFLGVLHTFLHVVQSMSNSIS